MFRFFIVSVAMSVAICSGCQPSNSSSLKTSRQTHTPSEVRRPIPPPEAFGAQAWKKYFGVDVGEEPPLPPDIEEILDKQAPFLLEDEDGHQRVRDNHLLTLIPSSVDGEAFTLDRLGDLALRYFPRNNTGDTGQNAHGYKYYNKAVANSGRRDPSLEKSYWLLLSKTILEDTRQMQFVRQRIVVAEYVDYRLPYVLEVATSLLSHYASSEECLYGNQNSKHWWTFTHCEDGTRDGHPFAVGSFSSEGLSLSLFDVSMASTGVSCCREL